MNEHQDHPQNPLEAVDQTPLDNPEMAKHSRRAFLFKLSLLLNAAVGVVMAIPLVGYILGPTFRKGGVEGDWVKLGNVDDFPIGQTHYAQFRSPVARIDDGDTGKVPCWVRRINQQQFQVFAINCAHLGCPVRWFPQSRLFLCPCHGGAYYEDGNRASGPPDRPLFQYKYKLVGNELVIQAGEMPTLATQASCSGKQPLTQITPATTNSALPRSSEWQA